MKSSRLLTPLALAVSAVVASFANAQTTTQSPYTIEVTAPIPLGSGVFSQPAQSIQASPTSDGGDLLRAINGVSGSRMGGRGIDPVIRGQSQNQLNVILDGAFLYGGCPNRMDPPTTYASPATFDRVTLIKGNRDVIYGPGGSGGTVLFERARPVFSAEKQTRGEISAAYTGNSDTTQLAADLAAGTEEGYVRFIAGHTDAGNYKDGSGRTIRSSFESESYALLAGLKVADSTWLEASVEQANEKDVLFPGAGMDSPYSDSMTYRLKLDHVTQGGVVDRVRAEIYRAEVDHLMDNFSLRNQTAPMAMRAPTNSDTTGGRLLLDSRLNNTDIQWGVDYQQNNRNASAIIAKGPMTGRITGIQWPDVDLAQTGVFAQLAHVVTERDLLHAGARYDHVRAKAGRTNETFTGGMLNGQTPNDLYGVKANNSSSENNLSGFLGWTHQLDEQYRVETTLSRSVRTADATERYIAMGNWRGNPSLDPEKHYQLEVVLASETADLSWSLAVYYNRVDDYILRKNNRYTNITAEIYGAEADLHWQITPNWQLSQGIAWVRGKNRDDKTNLSQIPPLTATLGLTYQQDAFSAGVDWLIAAKQDKVCLAGTSCGGQDSRKTSGYDVVNAHLAYQLNPAFTFSAGVNNLLDKTYANHLNREDVFGNNTQVNEPGRSGWVKLTTRF